MLVRAAGVGSEWNECRRSKFDSGMARTEPKLLQGRFMTRETT